MHRLGKLYEACTDTESWTATPPGSRHVFGKCHLLLTEKQTVVGKGKMTAYDMLDMTARMIAWIC
eukprot:1155884-Pelagomonas_calceolata.AAC.1